MTASISEYASDELSLFIRGFAEGRDVVIYETEHLTISPDRSGFARPCGLDAQRID